MPDLEQQNIKEQLQWITLSEGQPTVKDRLLSKGISSALVPLGCIVTCGILARGIFETTKKVSDKQKQQRYMRYRLLAQGITVALAACSLFFMQSSK